MGLNDVVGLLAGLAALLLGAAALFRKWRSVASWSFFAGMVVLGAEALFASKSVASPSHDESTHWLRWSLVAKALLPAPWLLFSLTYSRGNYRDFLRSWWWVLAAAAVVPVGLVVFGWNHLAEFGLKRGISGDEVVVVFNQAALALQVVLLASVVLVLMNLEKTIRTAVGTMRWRVKFLVLGLAVLFGARLYTVSQTLLFSGFGPGIVAVENGALLAACFFMGVAYMRSGFSELDIYPSRAVLESSVTVVLAGGYLVAVGLLAQVVAWAGGTEAEAFQLQAFLVLLGLGGLAVLLLSGRARQAVGGFVSRHFERPEHDFRKVWTLFTRRMARVVDAPGLCGETAKLLSETFDVLSVSVFLVDGEGQGLARAATTNQTGDAAGDPAQVPLPDGGELCGEKKGAPFDLERATGAFADGLRGACPREFTEGGPRVAVPLCAGSRFQGVLVLADRVNGTPYSFEERELLTCVADQAAATLLNLRLRDKVVQARELEAFQAVSAFFVHDMKNAASGLNLMLKNLPVHFDNPEFRADALRAVEKTADRINRLIARLSAFREELSIQVVPVDLEKVIDDAIDGFPAGDGIELQRVRGGAPELEADPDQLGSVVTNLVSNAREAVAASKKEGGWVRVETGTRGAEAVITVEDNGCGMSDDFVQRSLFRPFQTTKKSGLGIGMFQSRAIVEAHGGRINVASELGAGTKFRVSLPAVTASLQQRTGATAPAGNGSPS